MAHFQPANTAESRHPRKSTKPRVRKGTRAVVRSKHTQHEHQTVFTVRSAVTVPGKSQESRSLPLRRMASDSAGSQWSQDQQAQLLPFAAQKYNPYFHTEADEEDTVAEQTGDPVLAAALSPLLGVFSTNVPNNGQDSLPAWTAYYCLNFIWPTLFENPETSAAWIQAYYTHPLLFHTFQCAAVGHLDILRDQVKKSVRRQVQAHKTLALRHLSAMISQWDDANVEPLILVTEVLGRTELDESKMLGEILPFDPHLSVATNWLNIYGRLDPVEAHIGAMHRLLDRAGGLKALKLYGLADHLA
jgi:hypothetical protein